MLKIKTFFLSFRKTYLYCTETNKFTKKLIREQGDEDNHVLYYDKDYYNGKIPIAIEKKYISKDKQEALIKTISYFNQKIENVTKCQISLKQSLELKLKIIMEEAIEIGGWVVDKDKPIEKPNFIKIIDDYLPSLYRLNEEQITNEKIKSYLYNLCLEN